MSLIEFFDDHALAIVQVAVVVLAAVAMLVFLSSLGSRWRLNRYHKTKKEIRERLSGYVMAYTVGDAELETVAGHCSSPREYATLLQIVNELAKNVEGPEWERLQRLLMLKPIRDYFFDKYQSRSALDKASACLYFSRLPVIKKTILPSLIKHTSSGNPMLCYASTLALCVHGNIDQKEKGIRNALMVTSLSNQALSDIFVEMQRMAEDGRAEGEMLMAFIDSDEIPDHRKGQLIRLLGELGYVEAVRFLLERYQKVDVSLGTQGKVAALIDTLSDFGEESITDRIHREFCQSDHQQIREAAAKALGKLLKTESIPILKWMLYDADFYVRFHAARSLRGFPDSTLECMKPAEMPEAEWDELMGEIAFLDGREA
ncbi:MAG: HEAT repeat domain-containing protein [Balneolaceae bacterium]